MVRKTSIARYVPSEAGISVGQRNGAQRDMLCCRIEEL